MDRIPFESVGDVSPDDRTSESMRRTRIPVRGVMLIGAVVSVLAMAGAWMQARATPARQAVAFDEVQAKALRSHRRIMLVFTQDGCLPCARLEQEALDDPEVRRRIAHGWIVCEVDLDAPGAPEIAARYEVTSPPAIVLAAAGGQPLRDVNKNVLRLDGLVPADAVTDLLDAPLAGSLAGGRTSLSTSLTAPRRRSR